MKQLPGPGDTNVCPGCCSLSCTCGPKPMRGDELPTFELEMAYALDAFEDENDRQPNDEERKAMTKEVQEKIDSAKDAYLEWKATGGFICDVCDGVHYNWAPRECRDAHNSEHF